MSRLIRCLVVVVAAGAVLITGLPEAESARSASLADSRLITDKNDIYTFPQVGVEHTQQLSLDYGIESQSGSGLAILGDEDLAFGIGVHKGDLLDRRFSFPHAAPAVDGDGISQGFQTRGGQRLGSPTEPFAEIGPDGAMAPHTMVDLFGSADLGAGLVGGRLSLGTGGNITNNTDGQNIGASQTFGALTLGYSLTGDFRLDTSLTAQLHLGSEVNEAAGDSMMIREGEGHSFLISNSNRAFLNLDEGLDIGMLSEFAFRNTGWTNFPHEADARNQQDGNQLTLFGGAGPAYTIEDHTELALYGIVGLTRDSTDTAADDNDVYAHQWQTRFVLPGVHMAADIEVLDWLFFRSGLQYNYLAMRNGDNQADGQSTQTMRTSEFGWRAGIGIETGQLSIDGVFQEGFVTGGPDFLGGQGGGMFTMLSANYEF